MFGKKVGEKRLATRKMSGKNKIVEKILSLVKNSATFPRLFFFFKIRYIKNVCLWGNDFFSIKSHKKAIKTLRFAFTELTIFYKVKSCNVLDLICLSKLLMRAFFTSRSAFQNCQYQLRHFNLRSYKKYTEVDSWYW